MIYESQQVVYILFSHLSMIYVYAIRKYTTHQSDVYAFTVQCTFKTNGPCVFGAGVETLRLLQHMDGATEFGNPALIWESFVSMP